MNHFGQFELTYMSEAKTFSFNCVSPATTDMSFDKQEQIP